MQFNNTTTKNGIIQMIEQTTGLGSTIISGGATYLPYFTNLVNQWLRNAAYFAWKSDKSWSFDDSNQTTFPQPTTNIVNNQRDYSLPSTALRIRDVEVLDISGKYYTLKYIHEDDPLLLSEKEQEEANLPTHYRLSGQSIILYPKPNTTLLTATAGLRLTIDREVDPFTVSDTTQEPGIATQFHPILYYGPSFEFATIKGLKDVSALCLRMLGNFPGLTEMMGDFYANRNQDVVKSIKRKNAKYK